MKDLTKKKVLLLWLVFACSWVGVTIWILINDVYDLKYLVGSLYLGLIAGGYPSTAFIKTATKLWGVWLISGFTIIVSVAFSLEPYVFNWQQGLLCGILFAFTAFGIHGLAWLYHLSPEEPPLHIPIGTEPLLANEGDETDDM